MADKQRKGIFTLIEDNSQTQMSETFLLSLMLAFGGGFQDAYTFIVRGGVFANAQTGNVVLMSIHLMKGQWMAAVRYLAPLAAFVIGVLVTELIHERTGSSKLLHWRQFVLIAEIAIMIAAGFLPGTLDLAANILISLSCAMQVQAFRTVHGYNYASTMCIGNLRSGTEALATSIRTGRREDRQKAVYYFGVILVFALGAGVGGLLCGFFGQRTIWFCCITLLLAFWTMFIRRTRTASGSRKIGSGDGNQTE